MTSVRYEVCFTGRVQGVGFRYTTCQVAQRFDITGWVRNEHDGSVRCVAEGGFEELERFVAAVRESMVRHIQDASIQRRSASGEFTNFSVRQA